MSTVALQRALTSLTAQSAQLKKLSAVVEARLVCALNSCQGLSSTGKFAEVVKAADRELEAQRQSSHEAIPCKAGCNHCCSFQQVVVSTAEAVLLVRHIEERLSSEERAGVVRSILASGTTGANQNTSCALLTPAGCSVYESRPMPCRTYHSNSEPACRACKSVKAPYPRTHADGFVVRAHVIGMVALKVSRAYAHSGRYEINALLRRIYADCAKPARWAADQPTDESAIAKI